MNINKKFAENNVMTYFNYHAKVKRLIEEGHCTKAELLENYHGISPALVIFFDCNIPMPIREHRWGEYFDILNKKGYKIIIKKDMQ